VREREREGEGEGEHKADFLLCNYCFNNILMIGLVKSLWRQGCSVLTQLGVGRCVSLGVLVFVC
jgi:hypothetical protein